MTALDKRCSMRVLFVGKLPVCIDLWCHNIKMTHPNHRELKDGELFLKRLYLYTLNCSQYIFWLEKEIITFWSNMVDKHTPF